MYTVKTQKHRFRLLLYLRTIVPNDTRIHGILKVPVLTVAHVCFNNTRKIPNRSQVEIRTLKTNWGWSSKKIKNYEPRKNLLVLIKKKRVKKCLQVLFILSTYMTFFAETRVWGVKITRRGNVWAAFWQGI